MDVLLIGTYEMGRQPFGLASPAGWLRGAGLRARCLDLSVTAFDEDAVRAAGLVAFYLPMHTATRLALPWVQRVRELNPKAHVAAFGLYAPLNAPLLRDLGVHSVLGAEFEGQLTALAQALAAGAPLPQAEGPQAPPARLRFQVPQRQDLPPLADYGALVLPDGAQRRVGYTEATRGCKHLCRHCPIVPVYGGQFRAVSREVVLADVRQQVAAGAEHVTFGDPDFLNGPSHALRLVEALHAEFPTLSYDVVIKVEHLLAHRELLPRLAATGCLFITSAVEALDDASLARLEKGHTRADVRQALELCRAAGLTLVPTFMPFTPWLTLQTYHDLLETLADWGLHEAVAPVQLAIRMLVPARSRLLELPEVQAACADFDAARLVHPWTHPDPRVDALQAEVEATVRAAQEAGAPRAEIFATVRAMAAGAVHAPPPTGAPRQDAAAVPYMTEPWYC